MSRSLANTGLFKTLDEETLRAVEAEAEWVQLPGGETLFRQGDPGDALFVLMSGRLRVFIENEDGKQIPMADLARGEAVGEMAMVSGEPRVATVRAIRDSELMRLSKDAFERVVETSPEAMLLIARRLALRLEQMNHPSKQTRRTTTVAVVGVGEGAPLSDFSTRLAASLTEISGSTAHLDRELVDRILGAGNAQAEDAESIARLAEWMSEQEVEHEHVVLEADPGLTPWTMRCLRQADVVLLVARSASRPDLGELKDELTRRGYDDLAREELVLLHETRDRSWQGTEGWRSIVPIAAHHHVALDHDDDFNRLARTLTGRAVGVVLGGGGARGFAHIGVLRALEEAGIPADVVAGTSMGSLIAAQHALGLDYEGMLEINREGWIKGNPLKDRTLPTVAMLRGKKLERMLDTMFGETRIEDLWVRFFCVSSNLSKAELIIHQEGPLKRWVRASMAIPGVALPVCHEGDLISDGGVLNNLPGDVMRTVSGGTVVAVDVSPREDLVLDARFDEPPGSWSYLWNRMRPSTRGIPLPNIVDIMMRTAMLSSVRMTNVVKRSVDLYIRPPIDQFELFEWKSLEQIAEAGYQGAIETIAAWQAEQVPVHESAEHAVAPS